MSRFESDVVKILLITREIEKLTNDSLSQDISKSE